MHIERTMAGRFTRPPTPRHGMKINRHTLRRCKPEDVRRLARSLRLRGIDGMSTRQIIGLLHWLFSRREKRARFDTPFPVVRT